MPARLFTAPAACALVVVLLTSVAPAHAQTKAKPATAATENAGEKAGNPATIQNSGLDAQLFYQLLIGELQLGAKDQGAAYFVLLDAAKKSKSEEVFKRATDIALQARSGDLALKAAQAWKTALPGSLEASRYLVQLLVALNRSSEAAEPLRSMIALSPPDERSSLIASLPRFFERAGDRKSTPTLLETALAPYVEDPATRVAALVAIGRAAQAGGDNRRALELIQRAHALEPLAHTPVLLALDLLPSTPGAEPIVLDYLKAKPQSNVVRMYYARALAVSQRHADALPQIEQVTRSQPELPSPWLTLGALNLELNQPKAATDALQTFLARVRAMPAASEVSRGHGAATAEARFNPDDLADDEVSLGPDRGVSQALLMLAQAAEQTGDFKAAESWLDQVSNPQRALEIELRRASLLARQGRLDEAIEKIRKAPESSEDEARVKVMTEVQMLRERKLWQRAEQALDKANLRFVNNVDLLYEQAMMAEKLNRLDDMERLLRRVISLRPEYYHAHNALGYSLADRNVRLPEAKSLILRALELAPDEPFITDSLGWVEYRLGERAAAIKHLTIAYKARPDAEIAAHLGEVLWVDGQLDEARRILREGKARDASNEVLLEEVQRLKVDL